MKGVERFKLDDDSVTGINVTPLVDVCLVLVIIFMVATPLLSQPAFEVELPIAATSEEKEEDKVTISLGADGQLALDSRAYASADELAKALVRAIAATESGLVVVRADREATHGRLTDLMAKAKAAGARSITIATQQKR